MRAGSAARSGQGTEPSPIAPRQSGEEGRGRPRGGRGAGAGDRPPQVAAPARIAQRQPGAEARARPAGGRGARHREARLQAVHHSLVARLALVLLGAGGALCRTAPAQEGITAANVRALKRQQVAIDGTVDAAAIYLRGVFFVTTTYGKTLAVDAASGAIRWEYTPPEYGSWAGSYQLTTATPVADPD